MATSLGHGHNHRERKNMLTAEQIIAKLDEEGKGRGMCALVVGHEKHGTVLLHHFDADRLEKLRGLLAHGGRAVGIVYSTLMKKHGKREPYWVTGHRALCDGLNQDQLACAQQYLLEVDKQVAKD